MLYRVHIKTNDCMPDQYKGAIHVEAGSEGEALILAFSKIGCSPNPLTYDWHIEKVDISEVEKTLAEYAKPYSTSRRNTKLPLRRRR